jgi:hypothetical protein
MESPAARMAQVFPPTPIARRGDGIFPFVNNPEEALSRQRHYATSAVIV